MDFLSKRIKEVEKEIKIITDNMTLQKNQLIELIKEYEKLTDCLDWREGN